MSTTPDFSQSFHALSKDHAKGHVPATQDPALWPPEWRTVYYKEYPRLPRIALVDEGGQGGLFDLIRRRTSDREFAPLPLSLREISLLLKYSCGIVDAQTHRRAHPSAGARFPLEIYPLITIAGEVGAGLYHYHMKEHALETLWQREFSDKDLHTLFTYSWVQKAPMIVIMSVTFARTQAKYGERGYRYMALEAGHVAQNFYLTAQALGLKCCSLVGMRDENLESLLDVDGVTESVFYAVALGK